MIASNDLQKYFCLRRIQKCLAIRLRHKIPRDHNIAFDFYDISILYHVYKRPQVFFYFFLKYTIRFRMHFLGSMNKYQADHGVFITNSRFTNSAGQAVNEGFPITLINGNDLLNLIKKHPYIPPHPLSLPMASSNSFL